jgi:restriction system protein
MAVPDYESMMLPLLQFLSDGQERSLRECIDGLAQVFKLSDADRKVLLPSGRQAQFDNRVGWARTYLKKACLVDSLRRGFVRISERGRGVLAEKPARIDDDFLKRFSEFVEFQTRPPQAADDAQSTAEPSPATSSQTPEDLIEYAHAKLTAELSADILKTIMQCSPAFFERLVVELLVKMGYGGSLQDAGQAIGKSGDEGIDGIIKEDRLGLDIIYIQAKRWANNVSRPEIQKFVGALQGQRAKKGIFITTSTFSDEAHQYAGKVDSKVILIDGQMLARLMIEHDIGVSSVASYQLKKVDSDYFTEE